VGDAKYLVAVDTVADFVKQNAPRGRVVRLAQDLRSRRCVCVCVCGPPGPRGVPGSLGGRAPLPGRAPWLLQDSGLTIPLPPDESVRD